jgi:L-ascorbate peroxidase
MLMLFLPRQPCPGARRAASPSRRAATAIAARASAACPPTDDPTRRGLLLAGLGTAIATAAAPLPAVSATKAARLPVLDPVKVYGSLEKAEAARAAAVTALSAAVTGENAGALLRFAFHDAGTWDAVKGTGGANGSLPLELGRPENAGGLKYAWSIIQGARAAAAAAGAPPLTVADTIQVAGAAAVSKTGGPAIPVPLGRPDVKKADPGGQLPALTLDAQGLRDLFLRNGYTVEQIVALSGAHTLGSSRANPPKGATLSPTPTKFDTSYYQALLKGKGVFPSDSALMTDPEMAALVKKFARDKKAFYRAFSDAYIAMGVKGLAVA